MATWPQAAVCAHWGLKSRGLQKGKLADVQVASVKWNFLSTSLVVQLHVYINFMILSINCGVEFVTLQQVPSMHKDVEIVATFKLSKLTYS